MKRTKPTIEIKRNEKVLNNEIIEKVYDFIQTPKNLSDLVRQNNGVWEQVNYCQAWSSSTVYINLNDTDEYDLNKTYSVWLIKSYDTIVGVYFVEFDALIWFGAYSMTT